jgi:uncharacterized membrane protein
MLQFGDYLVQKNKREVHSILTSKRTYCTIHLACSFCRYPPCRELSFHPIQFKNQTTHYMATPEIIKLAFKILCILSLLNIFAVAFLNPELSTGRWFWRFVHRHDGSVIGVALQVYALVCVLSALMVAYLAWDTYLDSYDELQTKVILILPVPLSTFVFFLGRMIRKGIKRDYMIKPNQ